MLQEQHMLPSLLAVEVKMHFQTETSVSQDIIVHIEDSRCLENVEKILIYLFMLIYKLILDFQDKSKRVGMFRMIFIILMTIMQM